jgi:hypothetical protein
MQQTASPKEICLTKSDHQRKWQRDASPPSRPYDVRARLAAKSCGFAFALAPLIIGLAQRR